MINKVAKVRWKITSMKKMRKLRRRKKMVVVVVVEMMKAVVVGTAVALTGVSRQGICTSAESLCSCIESRDDFRRTAPCP